MAGPSDGARQPVAHGPGCSLLAIKVVKWSFKDTTIFKKPQLVMSVRDREGRALEPAQVRACVCSCVCVRMRAAHALRACVCSTRPPKLCAVPCALVPQEVPAAKAGTHQAFFFEPTLRMETPINKLPQGAAVFFEFRHWKDRPKKVGQGGASAAARAPAGAAGAARAGRPLYGALAHCSSVLGAPLAPRCASAGPQWRSRTTTVVMVHRRARAGSRRPAPCSRARATPCSRAQFSCKAYCFLEADEIKPGPVTLEVGGPRRRPQLWAVAAPRWLSTEQQRC